jgi:amino acid transporter
MSTTIPQAKSSSPPVNRRTLGVPSVTLMIISASAPLVVLAGGVTTTFAVTGVLGVPLSFLILGAVLAMFTVGYAAMSRKITNTGAFYSYVAQGISRPAGVGVAVLALVAYNAMQIGVYGLFGYQLSAFLAAKFGIAVPWWVSVFVCIAVIAVLGINRVDLSAKVIGVLVAAEFAIVIVYDIVAFSVAPEGISAQAFSPSSLFVPGLGAVFAFGIAAFFGFESAAIYSEESKNPSRTVARATYIAVSIIALFYAFSAWAMTVGAGPSQVIGVATEQGPNLIFALLDENTGVIVSDIAQLLFLTSLFAALTTLHNNVARYFFSLGRERVFPSWFALARRQSGAPWAGSVAQTTLAIVVVVGFAIAGAQWVPPAGLPNELFPVVTLFSWLTNTAAFGLVLVMALVSVSVIGYFRSNSSGLSLWQRIVAPIISTVGLFVIFVLILLNFNLLLTSDPTAPLSVATFILPALILIPAIAGVFWGMLLRRTRPDIYRGIGLGEQASESVAVAPRSGR